MDFIDKIHDLAAHIPDQIELIKTEEATKMAFVLPFINALGYNIFDANQVVPEFTMDIGGRKDEKVDYAIFKDGEPIILIECKWCGSDLDKENYKQLTKYFAFTKAKFGIFTNGIIYRFFSDLDEINKMDDTPFLELDMMNFKDSIVAEIKNFSNPLDKDLAYNRAQDLKYMKGIRSILETEFNNPSEDFVKFFASQVFRGPLRERVVQQFTGYTKKAFDQFIKDKIDDTLKAAKDSVFAQAVPPTELPPGEVVIKEPVVKAFMFKGERFEVKFWKDTLTKICGVIAARHKERFEDIFTIRGDKNIYFSRNKEELKSPELIEGTDIYVGTAFSKDMIMNIAKKVIALFDYSEDDLSYPNS
jgi:hypothetical protein